MRGDVRCQGKTPDPFYDPVTVEGVAAQAIDGLEQAVQVVVRIDRSHIAGYVVANN